MAFYVNFALFSLETRLSGADRSALSQVSLNAGKEFDFLRLDKISLSAAAAGVSVSSISFLNF